MPRTDLLDYEADEHASQNFHTSAALLDGLIPLSKGNGNCPLCEAYQEYHAYLDAEGNEWRAYQKCGYVNLYNF